MEGNINFIGSLSGDISGGGGGGSDVSITPTLSSGTKIADYEIDGEGGSLYAPTPTSLTAELPLSISNNTISIDLSDYATVSDLDDYQEKLTAGNYINIDSNNEISCTPPITNVWYTPEPDVQQDVLIGKFTVNEVTQNVYAPLGESIITETNSNGTYIKFTKSKVLICYKTVTETVTYTSWGSLYESSIVNLGNFAHEFKTGTVPVVNINLNNSQSSALNGAVANITNTSAGTVRSIRPNNPGSTSVTFGVVAYGIYE